MRDEAGNRSDEVDRRRRAERNGGGSPVAAGRGEANRASDVGRECSAACDCDFPGGHACGAGSRLCVGTVGEGGAAGDDARTDRAEGNRRTATRNDGIRHAVSQGNCLSGWPSSGESSGGGTEGQGSKDNFDRTHDDLRESETR